MISKIVSKSIFFSLTLSILVFANQDFKIISSNKSFLIVEYKPRFDTSYVQINNEKYLKIKLASGILPDNIVAGMPEIQLYKFNIGVPSETGNTIQVLNSEYKTLSAKLAPVPRVYSKNNLFESVYELNEKYFNITQFDLVEFGNYGMARDLPIQAINVYPIRYSANENRITLFTRIVIRINFTNSKNNFISSKDNFLKDAVVNYNTAKNWRSLPKVLSKATVINSVLANGKWFRFEVPEEGIYKITKSQLSGLGIDFNSFDPRTIKIYNNGGKVLSENMNAARPKDLVENAIIVNGEEDGVFNDNDYILFYGRNINFWDYDSTAKRIIRFYHSYSKQNYYWFTYGGQPGKRIENKASLNGTPDFVQTTTQAYFGWQEDKSKILPSGRLYMGDAFSDAQSNRVKVYSTKLDGIVDGSKIYYKINFANRSELYVPLTIDENGTRLQSVNLDGIGLNNLDDANVAAGTNVTLNLTYTGTLPDSRSMLKFDYEPTRSPSIGYLNYFEINYLRQLIPANNELLFYSPYSSGNVQYNLSGFPSSDIKVFDISDYANVKLISPLNINAGDCNFQSTESTGFIRKYIAISNSVYKTAANFVAMENSNLHGISDGAKFIIISPTAFIEQAERYKNYKETSSRTKMSTIVADVNKIYNEFSCGMQDVSAIRDFIKYAYDNWSTKPEYVLLFGDGTYDYKNVENNNDNLIITYESVESYSKINSYCSDDFYVYVSGNDDIVDLAIGRINATNVSEARDVIDKIIRYETNSELGLWRNLITLVADDGFTSDGPEYIPHTAQSEEIANQVIPTSYNLSKIYEVNYPTVQTAVGRRKPEVNKAIIKAINDGTMIMSWVGHGNPDVWAHEYVFEKTVTIPQLINDKYFFLSAATCDFGRYDVPGIPSSTELMLLKPDGGSIGTFTAARSVYPDPNHAINTEFYTNLLSRDSLNQIPTIGKAYYQTKLKYNNGPNYNDRKFTLFGDPTLRLLVPELPGKIDSINGRSVSSSIQIKALSHVKLEGTVKTPQGNTDNNFDGEAIITVYDSQKSQYLAEVATTMIVEGGLIYRGRVSVNNGRYSTSFVVPKDISYENKFGKIVGYIFNSSEDAVCFTDSIIVGGTDNSVINDGKGPDIEISFDNESSGSSYLVNPDCVLYVKLKDDTGLNTTGNGIGHTLSGIFNNNENEPIDFTNYFIGDLNSNGKSGYVKYNFYGLAEGDYKIQVKAWDVFNNYASAERNFTVVNGNNLVLRDVVNYPNPFKTNTTFTFQHNLSQPVNVKIKVYTVAGRLIKEFEDSNISDKFVKVDWDGRDGNGDQLANGIYLYKLIVKSEDGKFNQEMLGKLAIIR